MAIQTRYSLRNPHDPSLQILLPDTLTELDYEFLGRDFSESKVMMARRVFYQPENPTEPDIAVKAVAAYRELDDAFYVHCFWADGANEQAYDAEAITSLVYQLRKEAGLQGYDGVDFQCMWEMAPIFAFLQMHCKASPVAIFGFIPVLRKPNSHYGYEKKKP